MIQTDQFDPKIAATKGFQLGLDSKGIHFLEAWKIPASEAPRFADYKKYPLTLKRASRGSELFVWAMALLT